MATINWRIVGPAKASSSMLRCVGTSWRCTGISSAVFEESVLIAVPQEFQDPGRSIPKSALLFSVRSNRRWDTSDWKRVHPIAGRASQTVVVTRSTPTQRRIAQACYPHLGATLAAEVADGEASCRGGVRSDSAACVRVAALVESP